MSCKEPPAPGQQEEEKGPWQAIAALWSKASGLLETTAPVLWVLHPGTSLKKWAISQRKRKVLTWRRLDIPSSVSSSSG